MTRASLSVALCIGASLLVGWLPGYAQNPDFISGVAKVEETDYEGAIADLQKAVEAQPQNEAAWYYLGQAYFKVERLPEALEALTRSVELDPKRPGTRLYLGKIYEAQGATEQAIRVYQEELTKSQGTARADALVALARLYTAAGLVAEALEVLDEALEIEPNYVEAYYQRGLARTAEGSYDEAIDSFDKAREILDEWSLLSTRLKRLTAIQQRAKRQTPEHLAQEYAKAEEFATVLGLWPELNKARGDAFAAAGKWTEARNAYRHAMRHSELGNPADPDAHVRIARAYLNDAAALFNNEGLLFASIGVAKSATKSALQALSFEPDYAPAFDALGLIYAFEANTYVSEPAYGIVSHSYEEAIAEFTKALATDPHYFDALLHLAATYLDWAERLVPGSAEQIKAYDQAQTLVAKASALQLQDPRVQTEMARLQLALENYDEALELAQAALSLDRDNVSALNTAGLACYYRGRLGEATEYFSAAIEADDTAHQSYTNLANAFFQMQSWYRARREYRKALERIPEAMIANTASQRSYVLFLIAVTYHETLMYDQEIEVLNQALALDPNYFEALRQLGRAHAENGEFRAAEEALRMALDKALDDISEAEVYAQLGQMHEREGNLHKAVAAYTAALSLDPNNLTARQTLQRLQG